MRVVIVCVSVCVKATTSRPQCSSVSTLPSHRRLNVTSALELEFSPIVEAREKHRAAQSRTLPHTARGAGLCSEHTDREGGSLSSEQHWALTPLVQVQPARLALLVLQRKKKKCPALCEKSRKGHWIPIGLTFRRSLASVHLLDRDAVSRCPESGPS